MQSRANRDITTEALAAAIGTRVRSERQKRGWTLSQMAETAGVSRRMIVNVEQGAANPSVGILLRISDALGIGLPGLVEPPLAAPIQVTRAGDGAILWRGEHGGRGVLLAGTAPPDVVELWEWTLESGDQHVSEAHAPGTKELLQMHQGTLIITVIDQSITINAGDAVTFTSDVVHSYTNPGQETARFTLSVYEPGVGTGPRTENTNV